MKKLLMITCTLAVILLAGCNMLPMLNTPPVANFICQTANPVANAPVTFSAAGSNDAEDGQNVAARWDFTSDGVWDIDYSHGKKVTDLVTYTYAAAGTYSVKLEVRDSQNATSVAVVSVTVAAGQTPVNTSPVASFICETSIPQVNTPVTFNASNSNDAEDGKNLAARWDFTSDGVWDIDYSHGKKVTDLVTYTYAAAGTYSVKLEVRDSQNATHVAVVSVTVAAGQTPVNTPPVASFISETSNPLINSPVIFNASGSNDAEDGKNLAARWDFTSDGVWDIDYNVGKKVTDPVSFTYTHAGTYSVKLEVKDSKNATHIATLAVVVAEPVQPVAPIACFTYLPGSPRINEIVTFDPTESYDIVDPANVLQARWDFNGDNIWDIDYNQGFKANQTVTHAYAQAGTFTVILEVKNLTGLVGRLEKTITVQQVANNIPVANFTYSPTQVFVGTTVFFDAAASDDVENGNNLQARWDFNGDSIWDIDYAAGKKATDLVEYTYYASGITTVTLEVKDQDGASAISKQSITVVDVQPNMGLIQGFVVESRGGCGIGGVTITLLKDGEQTNLLTGPAGEFCIYVDPGLYQLIFTKNGYATSKVQDLNIEANQTIDLDLPLKEEFYEPWTNDGPTLVVQNFVQSSEVSPLQGFYSFNVEALATLGVKQMSASFTHGGIEPELEIYDSSIMEIYFETGWLPDGWNYIKLAAYDANNNYTERYMPIYVRNDLPPAQLMGPQFYELYALTFGESLQLMSQPSKLLTQALDVDQVSLQNIFTAAKDADSTIVTIMHWEYIPEAIGYKLYRSFGDESNYTFIGNVYDNRFIDTSAMLTPGQKVYYRVSAFNGSLESSPSLSEYTIPLDTFNVSLVAPAQDQVVTDPNPVLTWQYNRLVGEFQDYFVVVQGVTDYMPSLEEYVGDATSLTYSGMSLQNGKEYEWDVVEAVAGTNYSNVSYAISVSGDDASSVNGYYRFVTNF